MTAAPAWIPLDRRDPRSAHCLGLQQALETELLLFRHALPYDDKRAFFRTEAEAQAVVDRAVKGLPAGLRARVASLSASRADLEAAGTERTCLYARVWSLLVEFEQAAGA
ncbi:hypothetical protein [Mesoterricola sediminis]|uniref:Uncharacterized protein n=1 Tax=Mesoterricola sediminis TaxID=2927980 RepID=A0AA48KBZ3_9BACT|nr:hypothetical protein [Mesoterricola sediminis]BDU75575.1 hypothetical protein METESE_05330 [Mesoterricola sediminis]